MKKLLSLLIVVATLVMALVGCGAPEDDGMRDYKLSIGVVVASDESVTEVTETVASIVTDADGKIVLCRLDCVVYGGDSADSDPTSKVEQGDDYDTVPGYGMDEGAGDWYKQSEALEKYVVGKTRSEVASITLKTGEDAGKTDLVAGCTMAIDDLLKAIDNAFKSEYKISFSAKKDTLTAGLKVDAEAPAPNLETMTAVLSTTFSAVVMSEGKVAAAILDTAEPEITLSESGATFSFSGTKRELGEDYDTVPGYGMDEGKGDWYIQADAFAKAVMGKTASEVSAIAIDAEGKATDAEINASCTMAVDIYKAGIEAAIASAR